MHNAINYTLYLWSNNYDKFIKNIMGMQKGWKKAQQFFLFHCPQNYFKKLVNFFKFWSLQCFKVIFNLFSGNNKS